MRGGTSKGAVLYEAELPADATERDALLLELMGGPDALQIDGLGGGHPLTSKVALVGPSADPKADIDYLFLQIDPQRQTVSSAQNCGNILAAVGVFALEEGMVRAQAPSTRVRVRMRNGGAYAELELPTPKGRFEPQGSAVIDGVPGSGAPIICRYEDIAGSSCGALLPTGRARDEVDGIPVTLIDHGMPLVVVDAARLGVDGAEAAATLSADSALGERVQALRHRAAPLMGFADVSELSVPKVALLSAPQNGGLVNTRCFIPHLCHESLGVFAAVGIATACYLPGSVAAPLAVQPEGAEVTTALEHPSGQLAVALSFDADGQVAKAGIIRTARLLLRGEVWL